MSSFYREKIYSKYVEAHISHGFAMGSAHEELKTRIETYDLTFKNILPHDKNLKILELGCGAGFFLKYLETVGYKNCVGVDSSIQQVQLASTLNVTNIIKADIFTYLRKTTDTFDVICSFHVLEHLFKDEVFELLGLIYNKLKNSGTIIIEVPNVSSPLFGGLGLYGDFTHEVGFTPPSLRQVLLTNCFKNVNVFPKKNPYLSSRLFFKLLNYFYHSRFTPDIFVEADIIATGYKENCQ